MIQLSVRFFNVKCPPPPESLFVETAMTKNLIGRNPDQLQIIIQRENRDFNVLYKKCSFDLLRTQKQAINQTNNLLLQDSSL